MVSSGRSSRPLPGTTRRCRLRIRSAKHVTLPAPRRRVSAAIGQRPLSSVRRRNGFASRSACHGVSTGHQRPAGHQRHERRKRWNCEARCEGLKQLREADYDERVRHESLLVSGVATSSSQKAITMDIPYVLLLRRQLVRVSSLNPFPSPSPSPSPTRQRCRLRSRLPA